MLKKNMVIVLQGDSVTDAGRFSDSEGLGHGYARMTAQTLKALYPDYNLTIYNKGISGHRTGNLVARWDEDCINLKPDIVTILIGINDCWRKFDSNDPTSAALFAENYEILMKRVKECGSKLVILEPFCVSAGSVTSEWHLDLDPKIYEIRRLAAIYADKYIATNALFSSLCLENPPEYWAADGVHPTAAGHRVIASEILKAIDAI